MSREIHIAESEWRVMEVLWERPMQTIGEIRTALADSGWSDSTIKTLVRRLVQKNLLGIDEKEANFRYYPLVEEDACKQQETRQLLKRVYHGSVKKLLAGLVDSETLNEREVAELRRIIDCMED
ncbi:MAG: BlaI/MecI/CopY family transcriptional regulator [Clostridia bacterium]|nr:BlaI/MecI/CopY family transcriptional regulator [Clostridia bacterium]